MKKRIFYAFLIVLLAAVIRKADGLAEAEDASAARWMETAQDVISWKLSTYGETQKENRICDEQLLLAGSTAGDLYVFALSRLEISDRQEAYLEELQCYVQEQYKTQGGLSPVKATEWHRIALTVLACGGDAENFGVDSSGNPINLIADGTYYRGKTASLGAQGVNGWIWALLTLDAGDFSVPEDACSTREDMIEQILSYQLADGGFPLGTGVSEVDVTAMAIQALSPYYSSSEAYSFLSKSTKSEETRTVREAVDGALLWLSTQQLADGSFASYGTSNVNSTCQVLIALCSLGRVPQTEAAFTKNGCTITDAFLSFRQEDGGFAYEKDGKSNSMASDQALYTLAALWRMEQGKGRLYDLTDKQADAQKPSPEASPSPETSPSPVASPLIEEGSSSGDGLKGILRFFTGGVAILSAVLLLFYKGRGRKWLLFCFFASLLLFLLQCVKIQSVDEYYETNPQETSQTGETVTLIIRCDSIYAHYDELDESLKAGDYLPADGYILKETEIPLFAGDTAFTVLQRAAQQYRIPMEYQGAADNRFGSVYVQGIQYLYEFSCGPLSGWMFLVNGTVADVGYSLYEPKAGDEICWFYTCEMGKDIEGQ